MILDMEQITTVGGLIVFPDYVFGDLPKQPGDVKETVVIKGTFLTSISIIGTSDRVEN